MFPLDIGKFELLLWVNTAKASIWIGFVVPVKDYEDEKSEFKRVLSP